MRTVVKIETTDEQRKVIRARLGKSGLATRKDVLQIALDLFQKYLDQTPPLSTQQLSKIDSNGNPRQRWAWVKGKFYPVADFRTLKKGKRKGWYEVTLTNGRKAIVEKIR